MKVCGIKACTRDCVFNITRKDKRETKKEYINRMRYIDCKYTPKEILKKLY